MTPDVHTHHPRLRALVGAAAIALAPTHHHHARAAHECDIAAAAAAKAEDWLAAHGAPGLAAALVGRDGLLWSGDFGLADRESGRAVTSDTQFQFASCTKLFTALLLAQLATECRLDLDAPVASYIPELHPRHPEPGARPFSTRDLAAHMAGLTRDMEGFKRGGRQHRYSWAELLAWFRGAALTVRPGVQYKYSNYGYAILGELIERRGAESYRTLVRQRILRPLGMDRSGFEELAASGAMAVAYDARAQAEGAEAALERVTDPVWDFAAQAAASELIGTTGDMALFVRAHLAAGGCGVVSDAAKALLFTPVCSTGEAGAVGLGWHYSWKDGMPRWQHAGLVNGFHSLVVVRPDVGLGVVLAANGPGELAPLAADLLELAAPLADTSHYTRLAGVYTDGGGLRAAVAVTPRAELTLEVKGAVRLIPWGADTYRVIEGVNAGEWVRFLSEDGRTTMLWEHRRAARTP